MTLDIYTGGSTDICESSGNWSASLSICDGKEYSLLTRIGPQACGQPPAVDNAALTNTMGTWPIGSTAIYEFIAE